MSTSTSLFSPAGAPTLALHQACILSPPSYSVVIQKFDQGQSPTFVLGSSFARLHDRVTQDVFDNLYTQVSVRRVQWNGCVPVQQRVGESEGDWRLRDAAHIWACLLWRTVFITPHDDICTAEGAIDILRYALPQLVFIYRSTTDDHVVLHFQTKEAARRLLTVGVLANTCNGNSQHLQRMDRPRSPSFVAQPLPAFLAVPEARRSGRVPEPTAKRIHTRSRSRTAERAGRE